MASLNSHPGRWGRLLSSLVRRGRRLLGRLIGDRPMPVPPHSPSLTSELMVWPSSWPVRHRLLRYRRPLGQEPIQGLIRSGSRIHPAPTNERTEPLKGLIPSGSRMQPGSVNRRTEPLEGLLTSHRMMRPALIEGLIGGHKRTHPMHSEPFERPSGPRARMRPEAVEGPSTSTSSMRPALIEELIGWHKPTHPMHSEPFERPSGPHGRMRPEAVEGLRRPHSSLRRPQLVDARIRGHKPIRPERVEGPSSPRISMRPQAVERPSSMRAVFADALSRVNKRTRPMRHEPVEGPSSPPISMRPQAVERPSGMRAVFADALSRVHKRTRPMRPALAEGLIGVHKRMRPEPVERPSASRGGTRPEHLAGPGTSPSTRPERVDRPSERRSRMRLELVEMLGTSPSTMRPEPAESLTSSMSPEALKEPSGPHSSQRSPSVATPETRWRAALTKAPLESSQPLAGRWASLARTITGRARTRYTTGPATRRALRAAGALGATTGSVIHLSRAPSDQVEDAEVITHELAHSRTPLQRPRFLLAAHSSHDEEERVAERTARQVSQDSTSLLLQRAVQPLGQRPVTEVAQARELGTAGRFLPGLVDTLPVTGIGGLMEAARTAAGPLAGPQGAVSGLAAAAGLAPGSFPDTAQMTQAAGGALSSPLSAGQWAAAPSAVAANVPPSAAGGQAGAEPFGGSARDATDDRLLPVLGRATGGAAPAVPRPSAALGVADLDRLLDALEDNVLRELERRGGRYEGVF